MGAWGGMSVEGVSLWRRVRSLEKNPRVLRLLRSRGAGGHDVSCPYGHGVAGSAAEQKALALVIAVVVFKGSQSLRPLSHGGPYWRSMLRHYKESGLDFAAFG